MILRIQTTLFSCVLTNSERDLYPFALVFSFAEITEAAASSAPNPCSWSSSSGCVGWFFESVVGRILGSGCRIETVVGSLCVSSGCTSYPRCLQQVIGWSSASYPSYVVKIGTTTSPSGIRAQVSTVGFLPLATYIYLVRPIHQKAIKKIALSLCFNLFFLWVWLSFSPLEFCLVADHHILCVSFVPLLYLQIPKENLKPVSSFA